MENILRYFGFGDVIETPNSTPVESISPTVESTCTTISEPSSPREEPVIIPPNTTNSGKGHFYYTTTSKAVHEKLGQMIDNVDVKTFNTKSNRFKWRLYSKAKKRKMVLKYIEQSVGWMELINNIEQECANNPELEYGNPNEYQDNEQLDIYPLRAKHQPSGPIFRTLVTLDWEFNLSLPDGWQDGTANIDDITSSKNKRNMYLDLQQQIIKVVHKGIEFREQYYCYMNNGCQPFDRQFYIDLQKLETEMTPVVYNYIKLLSMLTSKQRKRLALKSVWMPKMNINLNWHSTQKSSF